MTSQEYDTLANVTQQTVGSLTWQQTFDQDGNLTSTLRPARSESARHNYDYDALGNLTAERKPGATFEHGYAAGAATSPRILPIRRPAPSTIASAARGLRTYADNTAETFDWHGARLLSTKDREGRVFAYDYNTKGQVWQIRGAGGSIVEQLDYHPSGQLAKWRTRDAELSYENYDLEGRPRLTRQKRYVNDSGFGAKTLLDEFTQEHEWNVHAAAPMDFLVTFMTANRAFSKAGSRLAPKLKELERSFSPMKLSGRFDDIIVTLVDHPPGYYREIKNEDRVYQVEIGSPAASSCRPADDEQTAAGNRGADPACA